MMQKESKKGRLWRLSTEHSAFAGYHQNQVFNSNNLPELLGNIIINAIPYGYHKLLTTCFILGWYGTLDTDIPEEDTQQ